MATEITTVTEMATVTTVTTVMEMTTVTTAVTTTTVALPPPLVGLCSCTPRGLTNRTF